MSKFGCMVLFCAFSAAMLQQGATVDLFGVGDSTGWAIPKNGAAAYTEWAADKNIKVGDILAFKFVTKQHDVLEVTKAAFDACMLINDTATAISNGPANVTLRSPGYHYFICTFPGHCQKGQKLAISVSGSAGRADGPSAATPTAVTTPPPPPPTSSSNAVFAGLGFGIASVAVGLFV